VIGRSHGKPGRFTASQFAVAATNHSALSSEVNEVS